MTFWGGWADREGGEGREDEGREKEGGLGSGFQF